LRKEEDTAMAILRGFFDGTVIPIHSVLEGAGINTFLAVTNNGPNVIQVNTSPGTSYLIQSGNSQAFFLTSGTAVNIHGPGCTASWELAVPG
jgi:hypothetical protein